MKLSDMKKLKEPFKAEDIEWRLQSCGERNGKIWGRVLAYITSRAVQERLDDVCGPDGWQCEINKVGEAYLCTLSIRVEHDDGSIEWIRRTDGADASDIEAVKGGISGAIKRAAVLFGIGRYLYQLKDNWAVICDNGDYSGKTKEGNWFNWNPPKLPAWALPKADEKEIQVVSAKLDDYIKAGLFTEEEISRANGYKADKNIAMLKAIADCGAKRYSEKKQGA